MTIQEIQACTEFQVFDRKSVRIDAKSTERMSSWFMPHCVNIMEDASIGKTHILC